jgi:hypothetical protein
MARWSFYRRSGGVKMTAGGVQIPNRASGTAQAEKEGGLFRASAFPVASWASLLRAFQAASSQLMIGSIQMASGVKKSLCPLSLVSLTSVSASPAEACVKDPSQLLATVSEVA